jgi:hypothetical protein
MKNRILSLLIVIFLSATHLVKADEGMWIPILLKELNESDMKARGLKLSAEDIFKMNKSSMKDAIVHFGGGCTGEMISPQGLMLTNHHCGYGQIQSHSSVEKDYLTNGFWAKNHKEELQNPGLTATFIVRMQDVTSAVMEGVLSDMSEQKRDSIISANIRRIEKETVEGTHYNAIIKPFFYGNEFYLFITETFRDVRLVGAPPSSIGKFGGDTDNWMWPRHTGDFALFRVYANKENRPADYSPDNVPFKPRHYFPISLKGVEEGDFTMVYGFPGRTNQYLSSFAVEQITNISNPARIKLRTEKLKIWDEDMKKSDKVRIQYAAKYASISNYHKKWIGENRGLKKLNAIEAKKEFEKTFASRVQADPEKQKLYAHLLPEFEKLYKQMENHLRSYDYFIESVMGVEILRYASSYLPFADMVSKSNAPAGETEKVLNNLENGISGYFKNYNSPTDKKVFASLLKIYREDVEAYAHPELFKTELDKKFKGDFDRYSEQVFEKSIFASEEKMNKFISGLRASFKKNGKLTSKDVSALYKDPAYRLISGFTEIFRKNTMPEYQRINNEINILSRTYMNAMRQLMPERKYYPDANSTLRVTFGQVEGYEPADGVKYIYYTTLDGIMEKEDPDNEDFVVPEKLKELYKNKDYGPYAHKDGRLRIAFVASNHTTGGNSGSPVIDAEGNLIGTNFDRSWESTMSDIMYDPEMVRNITCDIRYTLFVIDKFAGAKHLIQEMKIVRD